MTEPKLEDLQSKGEAGGGPAAPAVEVERLRAENRTLRRAAAAAAVEERSRREGFIYPELAPDAIDHSLVTIDADGRVSGVAEAVAEVRRRCPDYFPGRPADGTPARDGPRRADRAHAARIRAELLASGNCSRF